MKQNEIFDYLKQNRKQFKVMVDIATLQSYANFEIAHVGTLRSKTSLDAVELEILGGNHEINDDLAKGAVVGLAFPIEAGYILLGNEHTIIALLDKDYEQQQLLLVKNFVEGMGFVDYMGSYDASDYLFMRVEDVDPEAKHYLESWWFKEAKLN